MEKPIIEKPETPIKPIHPTPSTPIVPVPRLNPETELIDPMNPLAPMNLPKPSTPVMPAPLPKPKMPLMTNEYIREWQINLPEINIVHTKGREASIVKVTGVMPMKTSWHTDYFLIIFKYNLIANDDFIEIIGKKDYTYSSTYDLDIDNEGRFTYYFKLKNVDDLPAGTAKTIKLTHQIIADRPFGEDTDNDFESTIIFSQVVNVNITIKEGNEISTQPIIPNPTVPTVPPTVPVTPTDTTIPTIAPETTDTNSILLYAGLFVAALVLIKK